MNQQKATLRVVCIALLLGTLLFLVVALVLRQGGSFSTAPDAGNRDAAIFLGAGAVLLIVCAAAAITLPAMWARDARPATQELTHSCQIVRMAMLNGPALFGVVVYLMTGAVGGLAITGIAIFIYIALFGRLLTGRATEL